MPGSVYGWGTTTTPSAGVPDHEEFTAPAAGEIELLHIRLGPNSAATAVEHMGFQRKSVTMTGSARTPLAMNTRAPAKAGTYKDFASVTGTFSGSELLMLCAGRPNDEQTQWSPPRPNAAPRVMNSEIMGGKQSGTSHLFIASYVTTEGGQGSTPTSRNNGGRRPTQRGNWGFQSRSCMKVWWSGSAGVTKVQQNHIVVLPTSPEMTRYRKSWTAFYGSLTGNQTVGITGKTSSSSFGAVTIVAGPITKTMTGLASEAAFGTVTIKTAITVTITGLASEAAFGTVTIVPGAVTIAITGKASSSSLGALAKVNIAFNITGLGSEAAFGATSTTSGGSTTRIDYQQKAR